MDVIASSGVAEGVVDTVAEDEAALDDVEIGSESVAVFHGIEGGAGGFGFFDFDDFAIGTAGSFESQFRIGERHGFVGVVDFRAAGGPAIERDAEFATRLEADQAVERIGHADEQTRAVDLGLNFPEAKQQRLLVRSDGADA